MNQQPTLTLTQGGPLLATAATTMSDTLDYACSQGDVASIINRLNAGESIECRNSNRYTPALFTLYYGHFEAFKMLVARGADLSKVTAGGWNAIHFAARWGNVDCLKLALNNSTLDVNSITIDGPGSSPIDEAIDNGRLEASMLLIERGANIFMKDEDSIRAIDRGYIGPHVLQHGKDLRLNAAIPLLLLSKACSLSRVIILSDSTIPIPTSLISVLGNLDLVKHIAPFIWEKHILRDKEWVWEVYELVV